MIAASMRPDFSAASRYSVRFSSISSGISRRALVQRRDQVGEQVRRDGVNGAEAKHVPTSWLRPACAISRMRAASSSTFCACSTIRSPTGVTVTSALRALEQLRAELLFQLLDRHRQRRLADEAALRRPAEAPLLRDRDQVAQLVEGHAALLRGTRANFAPDFRMLEPERDGCFEVAQLEAAVVARALVSDRPAPALRPADAAMPSVS